MTIQIECFYCGRKKSVDEPNLSVPDSSLEKAVVELQIKSYPACTTCGKKSWKLLECDKK